MHSQEADRKIMRLRSTRTTYNPLQKRGEKKARDVAVVKYLPTM